jgi:hypothetical protein
MYVENEISEMECPKCNKNNLEVLRMHVFTRSNYGKHPYYEIICNCCHKVFTSPACLSIDEL